MARDMVAPQILRDWHGANLPPLARLLMRLATALTLWDSRRRSRKALSRLDDRLIADIGLDPHRVQQEIARPFWHG